MIGGLPKACLMLRVFKPKYFSVANVVPGLQMGTGNSLFPGAFDAMGLAPATTEAP
jgi:hypothetical protein